VTTLFANFLAGTTTDNPLGTSSTTINSAGFANLPVVTAPDIMWLVLDPEASAGAPEIVKVTAHSSSATSVTVERAQQSTTNRQHLSGTVWRASLTKDDADSWLITVVENDITDGAVTAAKLGTGSVTTNKLGSAAVTNVKMAEMEAATLKGVVAGGGPDFPSDLTATEVRAILATAGTNAQWEGAGFVPTLTNVAIGTGGLANNSAVYRYVGGSESGEMGLLGVMGTLTLGTSGASMGTGPRLTVPSGFLIAAVNQPFIGKASLEDTSLSTNYIGVVRVHDTDEVIIARQAVSGSNIIENSVISTAPFTWTQDDVIDYWYIALVTRS
jgi:hypothetical protein